jgi:hypothetical protein
VVKLRRATRPYSESEQELCPQDNRHLPDVEVRRLGTTDVDQNSGAFDNGKGGFYRFGALGAPDIICVIAGQYVGIEVKAPKVSRRSKRREGSMS